MHNCSYSIAMLCSFSTPSALKDSRITTPRPAAPKRSRRPRPFIAICRSCPNSSRPRSEVAANGTPAARARATHKRSRRNKPTGQSSRPASSTRPSPCRCHGTRSDTTTTNEALTQVVLVDEGARVGELAVGGRSGPLSHAYRVFARCVAPLAGRRFGASLSPRFRRSDERLCRRRCHDCCSDLFERRGACVGAGAGMGAYGSPGRPACA